MRGRRLFLNDSTPYRGPTYNANSPFGFPVSGGSPCPPGMVQEEDYCVDDTEARRYGGPVPVDNIMKLGAANVGIPVTTWLLFAAGAVFVFAVMGRR